MQRKYRNEQQDFDDAHLFAYRPAPVHAIRGLGYGGWARINPIRIGPARTSTAAVQRRLLSNPSPAATAAICLIRAIPAGDEA